jgi:glycosyltransferase involved in cell wall biosynthesis
MKKIVIASHGFSKDLYKVGSYHYCRELTALGYKTLLISVPVSIFHLTNIFKSLLRRRILRRLVVCFKGFYATEFDYMEVIPFTLVPFKPNSIFEKAFLLRYQVGLIIPNFKKRLKKFGFLNVDVLIVENPIFLPFTDLIQYDKLVYRVTDIYTDYQTQTGSNFELELLSKADIVVTTSYPLKEHLVLKYALDKKIEVIENGVELTPFISKTQDLITDADLLKEFSKSKIHVVYVGALDDRIDLDILKILDLNCTSCIFHYFGIISTKEIQDFFSQAQRSLY